MESKAIAKWCKTQASAIPKESLWSLLSVIVLNLAAWLSGGSYTSMPGGCKHCSFY